MQAAVCVGVEEHVRELVGLVVVPGTNVTSTSVELRMTGIVHESTCVTADASLQKNKKVIVVCWSLVNTA